MNTPQTWSEIHQQLQDSLQKEIELVREILGNLHQEELSLLVNDRGTVSQVLQERASLSQRLINEQALRKQATERLQAVTFPHESLPSIPLEQLLQQKEVVNHETLFLHGQAVALYQRMQLQDNRNALLSSLAERSPNREHSFYGLPVQRVVKKIALKTLSPEEEEE